MTTTLYDLSVSTFLQILPASIKVLNKAEDHFGKEKVNTLLGAKIIDDMLPLAFQIQSVRHHSMGAIEGVQRGEFSPPQKLGTMDFDDYRNYLQDALHALEDLDKNAINEMSGKPVHFIMGDTNLPFTAENFILSFSIPNFTFHATTLYNLLRREGLTLSKLDFLGKLRIGQ
jgi:hypothetical protein